MADHCEAKGLEADFRRNPAVWVQIYDWPTVTILEIVGAIQ